MQHFCVECGAEYEVGFHPFCSACGGMVDIRYPLQSAALADSTNPYVRFAALLPVSSLPERLNDTQYSPMVRAENLGRALGLNSLHLKNETALPTRSTKDRMAAISLAYLRERGVRNFCASSTGNSSTSFAYGIVDHPDMHLYLFTAERFVSRVNHADHDQVTHFGMRDASFVEAAEFAGVYARRNGFTSESGFFNPGRREGLKLAFLEATDQIEEPIDWYVQAVSSAMGVYGTHKGAKELQSIGHIARLPRLLCVQQESCAPMVQAFEGNSDIIRPQDIVPKPEGIAEAILRGDPTRAYPHIRRILRESRGDLVAASEPEIRRARTMVEDLEGISPCFSASTALAGLIRQARAGAIGKDDVIMVNLTGADRPDAPVSSRLQWLSRQDGDWREDAPARG